MKQWFLPPEEVIVPATPELSRDVIRSTSWRIAVAAVMLGITFAFFPVLLKMGRLWSTNADYSHGWLVAPFAIYLLWVRRDRFPASIRWPNLIGLPFLAVGLVLYVVEEKVNIIQEWLQGFAGVLCLAGVAVMFCGGWRGLRWAWPGLAFLPLSFMLPNAVEVKASRALRAVATQAGTGAFQTMGLPAYAEGNVIVIGETKLEVAEACSGLSMLLTFVAVAAAVALLMRTRPAFDRILVFASAVPIAVICNIIRIVSTGLIYHAGWKELGDLIVHDFFGWMMMPLALGMIWLELKILDWLLVPVRTVSGDDVLKEQIRSGVISTPGARPGWNPATPYRPGSGR